MHQKENLNRIKDHSNCIEMTRIITFNVNGIRSIATKAKDGTKNTGTEKDFRSSLLDLIETENPDILCLQEVRSENEKDLEWLGRHYPYQVLNYSELKKGYSGTAILSKIEPSATHFDFEAVNPALIGDWTIRPTTREGRLITCVWPNLVVVCVYTPNSGDGLVRLDERRAWDVLFRNYIRQLQVRLIGQHVIVCGDLNVAHTDDDIHTVKGNERVAGFTIEERTGFDKLLAECRLVDSWRAMNPGVRAWSWWSNFRQCRARDVGWRIDYVLVPERIAKRLRRAEILKDYWGSDHAPCLVDWEN